MYPFNAIGINVNSYGSVKNAAMENSIDINTLQQLERGTSPTRKNMNR